MRALLLLAMLAGAPAYAADDGGSPADTQARELFDNGWSLYDEGRYADAIEAWKAAYDLSPRPLILFNLANAYERLGMLKEAIDALARYRAFAPAEERDILQARMRNLSERLEAEESLQPPPDSLQPSPDSDPPTPDPVAPPPAPPRSRSLAAPLALFGVGAVGLAGGAVMGLRALDARRDARAGCAGEPVLCSEGVQDALRRDRTSSALADASFAVGIAAVGSGVAFTLLSSDSSGSPRGWRPLRIRGVVVSGRF